MAVDKTGSAAQNVPGFGVIKLWGKDSNTIIGEETLQSFIEVTGPSSPSSPVSGFEGVHMHGNVCRPLRILRSMLNATAA